MVNIDDIEFQSDEVKQVAEAVVTWAAEVNSRVAALERGRKRDLKRLKELEAKLKGEASNKRRSVAVLQ